MEMIKRFLRLRGIKSLTAVPTRRSNSLQLLSFSVKVCHSPRRKRLSSGSGSIGKIAMALKDFSIRSSLDELPPSTYMGC
jgi:hypothetical protein